MDESSSATTMDTSSRQKASKEPGGPTESRSSVHAVRMNKRVRTIILAGVTGVILVAIVIAGVMMSPEALAPDYTAKRLLPGLEHLFGTDTLGRDMFNRTIKGLSSSILIGVFAAGISACIALVFGILGASVGGIFDRFINWAVDLCMGLPHIILLILISFACGRGEWGVMVAVALTHWPGLTRVIRAEVLALRSKPYIKVSRALGKGRLFIAFRHIVPHIIPQFIVGLILLFPHAILHEAALTFLGFGLPLDSPAIGAILSDSMKFLSAGMWWLAVFPGGMLLIVVLLFYALGDNIKLLLDPRSAHE